MTEDTRKIRSSEELAFANIGGAMPSSLPTERFGTVGGEQAKRIQAEIDVAMRGAIEDARKPNPVTGFAPAGTVRPAGAGIVHSGPVERGTGWRDPGPLRPVSTPLAEAAIEAMTHQALPHGSRNAAFRGKKE